MAETGRLERDLAAEPHIRGRRIGVRQVYALVEERGEAPEAVADRYDPDVYDALAYYDDHPDEMRRIERRRERRIEIIRTEAPVAPPTE